MTHSPRLPDLNPIHSLATQEARRLCRILNLPRHDQEDIRQDLLLDFLTRLPAFDPTKADLSAFAMVCFRHAGSRIAGRVRRERAARHPISQVDSVVRTVEVQRGEGERQADGLTFVDTINESEGYGAWCGQSTNAIAALERRLDFDRAAGTIDPDDHPLCTALSTQTPHEFGETGTMPRARIYRRIREIRLSLLAAGIPSAA